MTKVISPSVAIDVTLDHGRAPIAISGAFNGSVEPIARWKVEGSWWNKQVAREYWKVLVNNHILCEIYFDVAAGQWFVDRVYD